MAERAGSAPRPPEAPDPHAPLPAGTWVELQRVLLPPGQRAPQVPEDTRCVPLEMKVKGFLLEPAAPGQEALVRTAAGRHQRGTLLRANPAYTHGFGEPVPELQSVGGELRALLRRRRAQERP